MEITNYRQEAITSLSLAREKVAKAIQEAQLKYKNQYDRTPMPHQLAVGDWVLVHFPQEESGTGRKLPCLWHGPYRVTEIRGQDVSINKVYFPQEGIIQVHLL